MRPDEHLLTWCFVFVCYFFRVWRWCALWSALQIRMELTTLAGLPKLTSLGTNADEVMRKLWAIESQETAAFHDKKTTKYGRLVIVDGEDPERANVSAYTENVLAPLRRQMLVVLPAAKDTSGTPSDSLGSTGLRAVSPALRALALPADYARAQLSSDARTPQAPMAAAPPTAAAAERRAATASELAPAAAALPRAAAPASPQVAAAAAPLAALAAAASVLSDAGTIVPPADAAAEVPIAATSATPHASLPPELFAAASESGGAAVAAVEPAGSTSQVMPQGRMGLSGLDLRALRPTN